MSDSFKPSSSRRTPFVIAVILLVSTLGVGLVTRQQASSGAVPGLSPGQTLAGARGPVAMQVRLDRNSVLAGSDGLLRMELSLRGAKRAMQNLNLAQVPTDFVVVFDRSGSMAGEPIRLAKAAVETLITRMAGEDRLALVSYSTHARLDIPLEAGSLGARDRWQGAIARIAATGGTHMSSGLDLAHELVTAATREGRVARVILLSDGHANKGDHSLEGLRRRARRAISDEYIVSAIGLGNGFDEDVMSAIADAGTGNFYYLPDATQLASIFEDELASARETVASALRVLFEPSNGVVLRDVGGYPLEHTGDAVAFYPGALFSGQERHLWLTLRADTGRAGRIELGRLSLAFTDAAGVRHRLELESLPTLACVEQEEDYYASFDKSVYRRSSGEVLGSLKRRVAAKMKAGDTEAAAADVSQTLEKLEEHQLRALGYAVADDVAELESLRDTISAPEAATPAVQNRLGKQLLQEGRDKSRAGAKR